MTGLQGLAEHVLLVSVAAFALIALWETFSPGRALSQPMAQRWACNLSFSFLDGGVAKITAPLTGIALASIAASHGFGILNHIHPDPVLAAAFSILTLDLLQYWVHRGMHGARWLWFVHRVHHSDLDFDVTTAFRFHPLEALLVTIPRAGAIVLLGMPVSGVVLYGILVFLSNCFQHANVAIDGRWNRALERVIVTPTMHSVHHSTGYVESNSNFGTLFSFWDRLFNTYHDKFRGPNSVLNFGLAKWRDANKVGFWGLLIMPFHRHDESD